MSRNRIKYVFIILMSSISLNSCSQDNLHQLEVELRSLNDSIKTIQIDTSESAKSTFNGLSMIRSGEYKGVVSVYVDTTDFFNLLVYSTANDMAFRKEVKNFHLNASCMLSEDNDLVFKIYKTEDLYFFLPMYPCWTNGYSDKSKRIIRMWNK